jgi:hypothetical protein
MAIAAANVQPITPRQKVSAMIQAADDLECSSSVTPALAAVMFLIIGVAIAATSQRNPRGLLVGRALMGAAGGCALFGASLFAGAQKLRLSGVQPASE